MQKAQNRPDRFPHVRLRSTLFRPASLSLCSLACVLILVILPPWPAAALWGAQKKRVAIRQDTSPSNEPLVLLKRPARIRSICGPFSCGCRRARTCTTICPAPSTRSPGFALLERMACASTSQPFPSAPRPHPRAGGRRRRRVRHRRSTAAPASCGEGRVSAAQAYADQHLYDALIDAFSMRSFVPTSAVSGHDHFFDTFAKFGGTDRAHTGEWLDEVATRAASQSEQYLELMQTPAFVHTTAIASEIGWRDDFAQLRDRAAGAWPA